jgi:hypothetical protein
MCFIMIQEALKALPIKQTVAGSISYIPEAQTELKI